MFSFALAIVCSGFAIAAAPQPPALLTMMPASMLGCNCNNPGGGTPCNFDYLTSCCDEGFRTQQLNSRFNAVPDESQPDFGPDSGNPDFPTFSKTLLSTVTAGDPNTDPVYFNLKESGGNAWIRNTASTYPQTGVRQHNATLFESGPSTGISNRVEPSQIPPATGSDPDPGYECGMLVSEPEECESTPPGQEVVSDVGSIRLAISLGQTREDGAAGALQLEYDVWVSERMPGPEHLQFNTENPAVTRVWKPSWHSDSYTGYWLRQVRAPGVLVDFDLTGYSLTAVTRTFQVHFYDPNDAAATPDPNGIYVIDGGATPFITWEFSSELYAQTFSATKMNPGGTLQEYLWEYQGYETGTGDKARNNWDFTHVNGRTAEVRWSYDEHDPDGPHFNEFTWYDNGTQVHQRIDTVQTRGDARVITRTVSDPDTLNRVTSYVYDANGKLSAIVTPEGRYTYFKYDTEGRLIKKAESWADQDPTSPAGPGRIVEYEYDHVPVDPNNWNPTEIKVSINDGSGVDVVALTEFDYEHEPMSDPNKWVFTRREFLDPGAGTSYRETVIKYDSTNNRMMEVIHHTGRTIRYSYEDDGSYDPTAADSAKFDAGTAGDYQRVTTTNGCIGHEDGVAFKTTITEAVLNPAGKVVFQRELVATNSSPEQISSEKRILDSRGRPLRVIRSNNTEEIRTYESCCSPEAVTDEIGRKITTVLDDRRRPLTVTRHGAPAYSGLSAEPDIVTSYAYSVVAGYTAGGAIPSQTVTLATATQSATGETSIVTKKWYDSLNRLVASEADGLLTTFKHEPLKVTETRPNGATVITERYPDGRPKSVTGTGVVHRTYRYGVDGNDQRYTEVVTGPTGGTERTVTTYLDALGRTSKTQRPGYSSTTITTTYAYFGFTPDPNENGGLGQLRKVSEHDGTSSVMSATLYNYDEAGRLLRTAIDGDNDDVLRIGTTPNPSDDRIEENAVTYEKDGGDWFRKTKKTQYRTKGGAIVPRITRERLTGFSGSQIAETIREDIYGNETTTSREIDSSTSMVVTETTSYTATSVTSEQVYRNGRLIKTTDRAGLESTIAYDGFGRTEVTTDTRENATTRAYESGKSRLASVTDAASNTTSYTYDDAGQLRVVTNADSKNTRYAYNLRGQVTKTWGDVPQPVKMGYDNYGQRTSLITYRFSPGSGWDEPNWPGGGLTEDETIWAFEAATGLLTAKTYADSNGTTYTYKSDGRLLTRTWERQVDSADLVTTYGYDADYGDLLTINYSDPNGTELTTPNVTMTYLVTGQLKTVEDGAGKRTISYDDYLRPESEVYANSAARSALYGVDAQLTTDYVDSVSYGIPQEGGGYLYTTAYFDRLTRIAFGTTSDVSSAIPRNRPELVW